MELPIFIKIKAHHTFCVLWKRQQQQQQQKQKQKTKTNKKKVW